MPNNTQDRSQKKKKGAEAMLKKKIMTEENLLIKFSS